MMISCVFYERCFNSRSSILTPAHQIKMRSLTSNPIQVQKPRTNLALLNLKGELGSKSNFSTVEAWS
jgi:hypothetical protein